MKFIFITNILTAILYAFSIIGSIVSFIKIKKIATENQYDIKAETGTKYYHIYYIVVTLILISVCVLIFMGGDVSILPFSGILFFPSQVISYYRMRLFKFDNTTFQYMNNCYDINDINFKYSMKRNKKYTDLLCTNKKANTQILKENPKLIKQFYITVTLKEYEKLSKITNIQEKTKTIFSNFKTKNV